MRKLKYVKLFDNFSYITEGLKYYLEKNIGGSVEQLEERTLKVANDINIPQNFLVVDLSDENKARTTWIDGYFYKIQPYLNKNLLVISSPKPDWNNQFDLGMKIENSFFPTEKPVGFVPNKGFKTFFLQIRNKNNNSMIQIAINEEGNEIKFYQDDSGGSQLFFNPNSIERLFDVCILVAKKFMSFDLNVETLSEDLFTALAEPTNDYNNIAQKDIESIKQFYLR